MPTSAPSAETRVKLHYQTVYPVVRIISPDSGGSGTIIYSEDRSQKGNFETFVLTNHHVITSAIKIEDEWSSMLGRHVKVEKRYTLKVEIFHYTNLSKQTGRELFDADIRAYSQSEDLALLQLRGSTKAITATVMSLPDADNTYLFDPVIVVGCSLSHPPIVTTGQITSLNDELDNKTFWMASAPIVYGSSGGAVFSQRDGVWQFMGVPSRVSVTGFNSPVTHMGYLIPLNRIADWARSEHLDFLFDKNLTPQQCFRKRDELYQVAHDRGGVSKEQPRAATQPQICPP